MPSDGPGICAESLTYKWRTCGHIRYNFLTETKTFFFSFRIARRLISALSRFPFPAVFSETLRMTTARGEMVEGRQRDRRCYTSTSNKESKTAQNAQSFSKMMKMIVACPTSIDLAYYA